MLEGDELDEEELAFKKSLEEQDEEFGNDEELEFDDKELAQLLKTAFNDLDNAFTKHWFN